jgi:hypothetical protein
MQREQAAARERFNEIRRLEQREIGRINHQIERERLAQRRATLRHGEDSRRAPPSPRPRPASPSCRPNSRCCRPA